MIGLQALPLMLLQLASLHLLPQTHLDMPHSKPVVVRLPDKHLDKYPNVVTEFGAVIAELGRQPKTARQFFIKYQAYITNILENRQIRSWKQSLNSFLVS